MSKTPLAEKKLSQARFFLGLLRAENAKAVGNDGRAVEAYTSACLGALKSAVYRLENDVGATAFGAGESRFKGKLDKIGRHRYDRMMAHRDFDVLLDCHAEGCAGLRLAACVLLLHSLTY